MYKSLENKEGNQPESALEFECFIVLNRTYSVYVCKEASVSMRLCVFVCFVGHIQSPIPIRTLCH